MSSHLGGRKPKGRDGKMNRRNNNNSRFLRNPPPRNNGTHFDPYNVVDWTITDEMWDNATWGDWETVPDIDIPIASTCWCWCAGWGWNALQCTEPGYPQGQGPEWMCNDEDWCSSGYNCHDLCNLSGCYGVPSPDNQGAAWWYEGAVNNGWDDGLWICGQNPYEGNMQGVPGPPGFYCLTNNDDRCCRGIESGAYENKADCQSSVNCYTEGYCEPGCYAGACG